jgi:hypothetical protein
LQAPCHPILQPPPQGKRAAAAPSKNDADSACACMLVQEAVFVLSSYQFGVKNKNK